MKRNHSLNTSKTVLIEAADYAASAKTNFSLLFFLMLFSSTLTGQYTPPEDFLVKVSYDLETLTFYSFPDETEIEELTTSDVLKLRRTVETIHVNQYLETDNNLVNVTTHVDSENLYPDWFIPPTKTVVDKDGTYKYDENEEQMMFLEHDDLFRVLYKLQTLAADPEQFGSIQSASALTEDEISDLEAEGNIVTVAEDGKTTVSKPVGWDENETAIAFEEKIFKPGSNWTEKNKIENEEVVRTEKIRFEENEAGENIPTSKVTQSNLTTTSGVCYQKNVIQTYSNYTIIRNAGDRSAGTSSELVSPSRMTATPNPVRNTLNVALPKRNTDFENANLVIRDIFGKKVFEEKITSNRSSLNISTEDWKAGTYFISFITNDERQTLKIVKN